MDPDPHSKFYKTTSFEKYLLVRVRLDLDLHKTNLVPHASVVESDFFAVAV